VWTADDLRIDTPQGKDGDLFVSTGPNSIALYPARSLEFWRSAPTLLGPVGTVLALPSSPLDGQECFYLADATNGVVWHLRYRTALAKWEFIGGGELYAEQLSNQASLNNSPNYTALAAAVQLTAPLAGTYIVEYGASTLSSTGTNVGAFSDVQIGATVGNDQNAAVAYHAAAATRGAVHKVRRVTCAANDVVALVHKAAVTTVTFSARTLTLRPVAVA
jgi:hypothetical protein